MVHVGAASEKERASDEAICSASISGGGERGRSCFRHRPQESGQATVVNKGIFSGDDAGGAWSNIN